ncbi:hypothetical protein KH5H1_24680 [Corallococcus caeni]|uniref:transglutaminase domain-containing protein n=1 Tax=Corallococcus caeni TaxID=3082388 RepID=UPI0029573625|nr:hypothetical protein KH5H1_24680 [Corallococcus sp. KH5-1]
MKALLAIAMLALPVIPASTGAEPARSGSPARFVFAWRGVPVGTVGLSLDAGRFTYTSRHLHVREGRAGERVREVTLRVDASGRVTDADAVPQALWLWRGPPPEGCVKGREELSGQEGPHCVTKRSPTSAEGTMLGARFLARYDDQGQLQALEVGDSRFTRAAPGERLRAPPELFAEGVPVEGGTEGALRLVPGGQARGTLETRGEGTSFTVPLRLPEMTEWTAGEARALSAKVHAAFPDKGPTAADWRSGGEGEAGGCLAHALRFASLARARGQRVGLVHGLLVVDGGAARPHAWVRVALRGGGTLDLDPTSLDAVRPDTHLALALVPPDGPGLEAGERWLSLLRGDWRVVRATRME